MEKSFMSECKQSSSITFFTLFNLFLVGSADGFLLLASFYPHSFLFFNTTNVLKRV
ncbi:BnaA09g02450D [Brassica napus]|uniref:BnaA09g02450D protein n=1 Tax=Brassica napus TaxID=3708 RepID=A0A078G3S8_BRANA|nr:BnaA09g02450D [Brassica napus]